MSGTLKPTVASLAKAIDHTLLRADATPADVEKLCQEAMTWRFATVCLNSSHLPQASQLLKNTGVLPIAVVGFPLGTCSTETKVFETRWAIAAGAREIDMVIHVGFLKSGREEDEIRVSHDIRAVAEAAKPYPLKVILETGLLTHPEKIRACRLAQQAGAAFVKTSTGFGPGGATVEDIQLMRETVGPEMGVKASGGIRTLADVLKMLEAGANRIGASAGVKIMQELENGSKPAGSESGY